MTTLRTNRFRLRAGLAAAAALLSLGLALPVGATPMIGTTVTYPQDTDLVLSGSGLTLKILAGSKSSALSIGATSFTLTVAAGDTFTVRYPGPNPGDLANNVGLNSCNFVAGNNDVTVTGQMTLTFTPVAIPICVTYVSSGGGGGGGGAVFTSPYVTVTAPDGGETLTPGSARAVTWNAGGTGVSAVRLSLSTDSGATFGTIIAASAANSGTYSWIVPDLATTTARVRVDGLDANGTALAFDVSNTDFKISGLTAPPPAPPAEDSAVAAAEAGAPADDSNSSGSYAAGSATDNTPTINVDKELPPAPPERPLKCQSGSTVKGSLSAVYFCGKDGKRYVFPNQWVYLSSFPDFNEVKTIDDQTLASIPLGGNVTYRPGVRMIKIQTDPKVYAIARGGLLRWVTTEAVARKLYGARWNRLIDDVSDAFFVNYRIGDPITEAEVGL